MCVGTGEGKTDVVQWTDVGLSANLETPQLSVPDGADLYATVKSYNGQRLFSVATERVRFIAAGPAVSNMAIKRTVDGEFVTRASPRPAPGGFQGSKCAAFNPGEGWVNTCVMVMEMSVAVRMRVSSTREASILQVAYAVVRNEPASTSQAALAQLTYSPLGFDRNLVIDVEFEAVLPTDTAEDQEYRIVIRTENKIGHVGYSLSPLPLLYYKTGPNTDEVTIQLGEASSQAQAEEVYAKPGNILFQWDKITHASGIFRYDTSYTVTSGKRTSTVDFQPTQMKSKMKLFPDVKHAERLHVRVRTTANAGLSRDLEQTIVADGEKPVCNGIPLDLAATQTLTPTQDISFAKAIPLFRSQWLCSDALSGVSKIMAGVGTSRFAHDFIKMTEVPATQSIFDLPLPDDQALKDGTRYYVKVVVEDGVGWQISAASDGLIFDQNPPTCEGLFAPKDGQDQFRDKDFHGISSTLDATWNYAFDTVSQNTLNARIQAQRLNFTGNETVVYPLSAWIDVANAKKATIRVPRTAHNNTYRVAVLLTDHAGNEAECYTDGITVGMSHNCSFHMHYSN